MKVKGEAFRELVHLQKRLNSLFEEMLSPGAAHDPVPEYSWTPSTDIFECEGHYHVEIEVPGVLLQNIDLTSEGSNVRISGRRENRRELTRENVQRIERYFGPFQRNLTFPSEVEGDRIEARLEGGVLYLRIPRKKTSRRIKVE